MSAINLPRIVETALATASDGHDYVATELPALHANSVAIGESFRDLDIVGHDLAQFPEFALGMQREQTPAIQSTLETADLSNGL